MTPLDLPGTARCKATVSLREPPAPKIGEPPPDPTEDLFAWANSCGAVPYACEGLGHYCAIVSVPTPRTFWSRPMAALADSSAPGTAMVTWPLSTR